jgi:hypothetical protein
MIGVGLTVCIIISIVRDGTVEGDHRRVRAGDVIEVSCRIY